MSFGGGRAGCRDHGWWASIGITSLQVDTADEEEEEEEEDEEPAEKDEL